MPRLTNSLPKYRKHRASGQAIVTLDGRDFYLGPHGTKVSRQEYDRLVGEWQANGRCLPVKQQKQAMTVTRLAVQYLKFAQTYYVKNGRQTDEVMCIKVALRHLRKLYGSTPVDDFGPLSLVAVRESMVKTGNSRGYVNKNTARLKRCFKWGVANELVPPMVFHALATVSGLHRGKTTAREPEPVLPIDDSTVEKTIDNAIPVVADMIRIQRYSSSRPGEVFAMRPCDIDRNGDIWKYVPPTHKTEHRGRKRVILIGPKAQEVLTPYLLRPADSNCFERPRGGVFKRWHYVYYIEKACKKAGVNAWAPNRLRHTAASEIRSKYGLEAAQVSLGHSTADVTQVYAERDMELAARVAKEVG